MEYKEVKLLGGGDYFYGTPHYYYNSEYTLAIYGKIYHYHIKKITFIYNLSDAQRVPHKWIDGIPHPIDKKQLPMVWWELPVRIQMNKDNPKETLDRFFKLLLLQ